MQKKEGNTAGRRGSLKRIRVHYTGTLEDGTIFDSSREREPLVVPLGQNRVIRGFEKALSGMVPGETKRVRITPAMAYGPHREELVTEVGREKFPEGLTLRVGQHLRLKGPGGVVTQVQVAALTEHLATLDANHPLAGKTLIFDLEVLEVF